MKRAPRRSRNAIAATSAAPVIAVSMGASPASAAVTPATALEIATAMDGALVTDAEFEIAPAVAANGVGDSLLNEVPTAGTTFGILTNGDLAHSGINYGIGPLGGTPSR